MMTFEGQYSAKELLGFTKKELNYLLQHRKEANKAIAKAQAEMQENANRELAHQNNKGKASTPKRTRSATISPVRPRSK